MKKILLLLMITTASLFAQYTTPNTGVNWNLDDLVTNSGGVVTGTFPNYSIINKVNVSANDRVYVLPGSIVTFSGSASGFEVYGKFLAQGTSADSIIFSSLTQDSTGSAYNGFYFRDTAVDSACIISYAKIEYAYYGLRCFEASPTLTNSYLWKCRRGVNLSSNSNPVITHNRIERSFEYGITLTTGCSPIIEWNELINNNSQNTSPKNQISIGTQGNNSPTIRHNIIRGGMFNRTGGISISTLFSGSSSSSEIAYNEIYNNSFGIAMTGSNPITCYIHDNIIYNNNINPDVMTSGSGINTYGTAVVAPVISRNRIYGNWWGITIQVGIAGQPGANPNLGNIENADTTDDGLNIIYDNVQGTNVYDLYNNTPDPIYAQNNDWGVYDSATIEDHIFHFVDDSLLGVVHFMPFSNSVPVELTLFTASVNNGIVLLEWTTATELNNSGFEIERRIKKDETSEDWERIGFTKGRGTSTQIHSYSFGDENPVPGKSYYRLKQIDFDGTYKYSNIVEVDFVLPVQFNLEQNYPNPFNPLTSIKYAISDKQFVQLKIFDLIGNEVATLVNEEKPAGNYEIVFNASVLSSGVYFYKIVSGNFTETKKMILLK